MKVYLSFSLLLWREKVFLSPSVGAFSVALVQVFSPSSSTLFLDLVAYKVWLKLLINMDQEITGGIQHLQLTTEEEEEISISTTSSDLLEECTRAFKSTLRTAWKMGSDLRIVDVGIKVFQFKFSSSFQMEWLPNFCFICGVLCHGEKHHSRFQGKSECHRLFGD